ncbi:glycoside hydrolase family 3 protein [Persicobacter psychrovividus]|uniref:beta-N-acetylhexosaminidase n=1 Tax=Persicobacter psychrovividus TaxID=387638 RepID=A0ABM7VI41_9BACT|nr:hypothetical protein PEPS_29270 [Persicobacter psychrovividus]
MKRPPYLSFLQDSWVNTTLTSMSLDQKIGQLFQVAAFSNRGQEHEREIMELITKYHLGGLTFFQGTVDRQIALTNQYQTLSAVPLFINIDAEWGLAMRLSDGHQFPYQMTLGALRDDQLIFEMAQMIGQHCKALGIHSPLAPVVDVNNNPDNPVINYRSFGADPERVSQKSLAYMKGLQAAGVLDNIKHFPGHGDTAVDSHLDLPILLHDEQRLQTVELYPFQRLISEGCSSVMIAHLQIPAWDKRPHRPATLSQPILKRILKGQLGFQGLIISDALDMHGITKYFQEGAADCEAILAGNHILTNSLSVPKGIERIKEAIQASEWSVGALEEQVRHILAMKKWVGANDPQRLNPADAVAKIDLQGARVLNQKIAEQCLTMVIGESPRMDLEQGRVVFVHLKITEKTLSQRESIAHHFTSKQEREATQSLTDKVQQAFPEVAVCEWRSEEGEPAFEHLLKGLSDYEQVHLAISGINIKPLNHFDLPPYLRAHLLRILEPEKVHLSLFGNPFAIDHIADYASVASLMVAYQDMSCFEDAAIKLWSGKIAAQGQLPVPLKQL